MEPLQEIELISLAEDIDPGKYSKLCNVLGYSYAKSQSHLVKHLKNVNAALEELLIEWNNKQTDITQNRSILASKLIELRLGDLGDRLSEGKYLPNQQDVETPVQTSRGIYSKRISASLTVQQCRAKLENKYINQLCKIQMMPWDLNSQANFEDMHTVVTMVKKDALGQYTKKKETLRGSVAEIFSTKVNGRLPARILVSAPAGRGKTTAVAKMAYDWVHREKGSALEQLPLLFVVKFRNTSKHTSIGEAIKSQLLSDVEDLTPQGLESFIRENQGICHIILDGLDEYSGISYSNRSSNSNILSVIRWEEFPECRVLVTTRPHLENFFNQGDLPKVYTKMWIEGFSRDSSREYIDKFFASASNPDRGHDMKAYLDDQPLINELAKTPLFCQMVCHLWSEELLNSEISTQTELLDSVNVLLMHHANNRSKSKGEITVKALGKIVCRLGKVALAGLLGDSNKLIFTPHDFRGVSAIIDRAFELGILFKTTVTTKDFRRSHKTDFTTIEFYHKLAQEHSAGKHLAAESRKHLWPCQTSMLDRVLHKIDANIGDYENLIRFLAGTDNNHCTRIMEALLSNNFLEEIERYRILLDCSSESKGNDGNVSSLIQRCVTAQSIVLKSPTVYTVVGIQNLPKELKREVRTVKFEGSNLTTDVTSGLWSCFRSFSMLHNLIISESSLSFPSSPPELPSVTKLLAEGVASQSYEGLLSSLPGLGEIDITIVDVERDISQITAGLRRTGGQQLTTIRLKAPRSLASEKKEVSRETLKGLCLLIREHTLNLQLLRLSGMKCLDDEGLVELVETSTYLRELQSLHLKLTDGGYFHYDTHSDVQVMECRLSTKLTDRMWSCLRSFTSMNHLTISDSSLSFPPSPPKLPSVTKLSVERVTSQSYEGLPSSLPGLREIDITVDDAEIDIPQITAAFRQTRGQQITSIILTAPSSLPLERKSVSTETMRGLGLLIREQTKSLQWLCLSRVKCRKEQDLVELVDSCKHVTTMNHLMLLECGTMPEGRIQLYTSGLHESESLLRVIALHDDGQLFVKKCHLSSEMTARMWSCLRSFTSLEHLNISNSSLSFHPSPPELPSVTTLSAMEGTSQSYTVLLSSLPGLKNIKIDINDAERDIAQIMAGLRRTGGQQLTHIAIKARSSLPSEKKSVSRETMRELGQLIREQTKNLQCLKLFGVKCVDEKGLVELVECSRSAKTISMVWIDGCGTTTGGRLEDHLGSLNTSTGKLAVIVIHDGEPKENSYRIAHTT